jgi:hypothetical protein
MPDPTHELWCLIEGDRVLFSVLASMTTSVAQLKRLIKEEGKITLGMADAKDLIVSKVCYLYLTLRVIIDTIWPLLGYDRWRLMYILIKR